jgi:hypothetical protein
LSHTDLAPLASALYAACAACFCVSTAAQDMALHVPWEVGFGEFLQLDASPMMTAPGPARQLTSRDRVPPSHALEQSPQVPGVHVYPRKEVPGNVMQPRHLAHLIFVFLIKDIDVLYSFVRVKSNERIVSLRDSEGDGGAEGNAYCISTNVLSHIN